MAEAVECARWGQTAAVLTQLANAHGSGETSNPMRFFPWSQDNEPQRAPPLTSAGVAGLRKMYPKKG